MELLQESASSEGSCTPKAAFFQGLNHVSIGAHAYAPGYPSSLPQLSEMYLAKGVCLCPNVSQFLAKRLVTLPKCL